MSKDQKPTMFGYRSRMTINRSMPVSTAALVLIIVGFSATIILLYQWVARAVIFEIQPQHAKVHVQGLHFNIGANHLLLSGDYQVTITAPGYHALESSIAVTKAPLQNFKYNLQPMPGKLNVLSELSNIEVTIDEQKTVTLPGIIENLTQGTHKFTFHKHRYFPESWEMDILGLNKTQEITISLKPAWGEMAFDSQPQGADFYVDDQFVGKTPLSTEILETGNTIRLEFEGYKAHQQQVAGQAGASAQHPIISMEVADGALHINSVPSGANITIDNQFLGTTPIETQLAPFKDYRIELFKQGYIKAAKTVNLQPQQTSTIEATLIPDLGNVTINLLPDDAEIQVNDKSYGKGSRTLSLSTKTHQLTIQKTGYQPKTLSITPKTNQAQTINVSLLTLEEAYWATRPPSISTTAGSELKLFRPDQVFFLGAPRRQAGRRANEVQRLVALHRPFYLGVTEVSNQQFRKWKEHNSSALRGQSLSMENQPAVNLSWNEAALYCNWLSQQQGLPKFYQVIDKQVTGYNWQSHGYRLPTEAEWAWAAKVEEDGQTKTYGWDNDQYPPTDMNGNYADQSGKGILPFFIANYQDGSPVSSPVGSYKANSKGLYNMGDNVSEWVNDFYDLQSNMTQAIKDPKGPQQGNRHVIRGANWALSSRGELRLGYRDAGNSGRLDVGFRVARYVDKPEAQP